MKWIKTTSLFRVETMQMSDFDAIDAAERLEMTLDAKDSQIAELHSKLSSCAAELTEAHKTEESLQAIVSDLRKANDHWRDREFELLSENGKQRKRIEALESRLGHFQRGFETILGAVPTTWCDPLLTGEDGITVPADWTNIEKLLNGLKGRIKAIVEEAITVEGQRPEQCGCTFCVRDGQHESDCAVHLPPAYDSGICDCSRAVEKQDA